MFKGSMVALITPMDTQGALDETSLRTLIEWQIGQGTQAIVVAGTTGESALLTLQEKKQLLKLALEQAAGRVPIIVGTGACGTADTIVLTQMAMESGADAALIMTPPYVKPTQEGLYEHYKRIASNVAMPIILYNVPKRTQCDMLADTVERLADIPNIVGIKEASKVERTTELISRCGNRIDIYSGEDQQATEVMLAGAKGVISVTANVAPKCMQKMCQAALAGDKLLATRLQDQLTPLHTQLFVESSPIPVKWALSASGRIQPGIRLPLTTLSVACQEGVRQAMEGME